MNRFKPQSISMMTVKHTAKVITAVLLSVVMLGLCGCDSSTKPHNTALDTSKAVKLTIAGMNSDFVAMENAAQEFNKKFPNCTIEYEYLQDFKNTLVTRLESDQKSIDLFVTDNIQSDSAFLPYALDLLAESAKLDLSANYGGLTDNFKYLADTAQQYAIPLGGELRGLFVNKTLLSEYGLTVPKNRAELLNACKVLSENGIIAMQGNPGAFSQQLLFPYITNIVSKPDKRDEIKKIINSCDESAAELFRDPMQFTYSLVESNYYNYKYMETEYGYFVDMDEEDIVKSFLNIGETENGEEKLDDIGKVAFMPSTNSFKNTIDKAIADYHSKIEYEFILAPVADEGGFAYLSPSRGIAINKNSDNVDWALEFVNYLFTEEANKKFASDASIIPNTKDALQYISKQFSIPEEQITQPADIAFDFSLYNIIRPQLVNVSKGNNPKYMKDNGDGTVALYDFEYYMDGLKNAFKEQKENGEG